MARVERKEKNRETTRVYFICDGRGCQKRVTLAEYCYGCRRYLCARCEGNDVWGPHELSDHRPKKGVK